MSGRDLSLALLLERPTIEALAEVLRQQIPHPVSPVVPIQPLGSKPPMFFVHALGGGTIAYFPLAQQLGRDQPFYGLEAPGMDGQREPLLEVSEMAAHYLEALRRIQPLGPYRLGGHSFGALVAFEMAQQLRREGTEVAVLAILDAGAPVPGNPFYSRDSADDTDDDATTIVELAELVERVVGKDLGVSREKLSLLDREEQLMCFLEKLKEVDFVSPDAGTSLIRGSMAVYKACGQAFQNYKSQAQVYPGPVTLFVAEDITPGDDRDRELHENPTLGWSELVSGEIETHAVPGDHISMLNRPHVHILANKLVACIDKSRSAQPPKGIEE